MRIYHPALAPENWLSSLKARQLQRVAFETGILSSGTKPVLIDRLTQVLQKPAPNACTQNKGKCVQGEKDKKSPMSILSIDMGIRNLAYAHLLVPRNNDQNNHGLRNGSPTPSLFGTPELNAWNRLAISSFPSSMDNSPSEDPLASISALSELCKGSTGGQPRTVPTAPIVVETVGKESFAPKLYASHAYTLITSLIDAYKPTHILIEKQRFRSGGGSAVQEWTIRVGVFEGMLYAVLHTLQQERKERCSNHVCVQDIDPQRVVKFWLEKEEYLTPALPTTSATVHKRSTRRVKKEEDTGKATTTKRITSKEGKKAKIDLVGKWISHSRDVASISEAEDIPDRIDMGTEKLRLGRDRQASCVADAYLRKWKGEKRKAKSAEEKGDIGKLDDLADCLLQGLTWLDWETARNRISRDGPSAIPGLEAL